jgi:hypothetical protein
MFDLLYWVNMVEKVVQTELSRSEYERLKKVSTHKKISLKEALRQAVEEWVRRETPIDTDPLFRLEPKDTGVETDSSSLDKELYGKRQ